MSWRSVDSVFILKATINSLAACLIFIYLYFRKKLKIFLWLSIVFLMDCFILNQNFAYYTKFSIFILMIIVSLAANFKEINELDKSGEKTAVLLKIDNLDKIVFALTVVLYLIIRINFIDINK